MIHQSLLLFLFLLFCSSHIVNGKIQGLKGSTIDKLSQGKKLNRKERNEIAQYEKLEYQKLRRQGYDEVSNTNEAVALRNYRLRKRKRMGLFRKRETSLSQVFFPGSRPTNYAPEQSIMVMSNFMESRRHLARFDISQHPAFMSRRNNVRQFFSLGARLQGISNKVIQPMLEFQVQQDLGCTPIQPMLEFLGQRHSGCLTIHHTQLAPKQLKFVRFLIKNRYRMHLSLDGLPVLMRSKELNYAVKGVPIGFIAPPSFTGSEKSEMYLYNHWRFKVSYHEDKDLFDGVRIIGFDVHPVSIDYKIDFNSEEGNAPKCEGGSGSPENNPATYLSLDSPSVKRIKFSYEVEWARYEVPWEDRWDVYFLGLPDDAIHYFSMLNSVICMLTLAAVVAVALIRVFRKDLLGGTKKENGWKHVRQDVFRAPSSPMLLSVLVGNGLHLLVSAIITMMLNVCHVINTMKAGEALTGWLLVYAATGSLGGYTTARLHKLLGAGGEETFKWNVIMASTALSGSMVILFCFFNVAAEIIGSSYAGSDSVLYLILAWVGQVGLTYWGFLIGDKAPCISVPTETSDTTIRPIPDTRWTKYKRLSVLACGMICFGVLYVELHFLMSAIWLRQTYLGLGYMLTVTVLATIVCAECAICVCYLQLNSEDYHWWWTAFRNGSAVGGYMVIYTLYYRSNRMELVGMYSNLAYFSCMILATLCIGIVCGSIGFLSCLWFTRTIFSAIDLDSDDEDVVPLTKDVSDSNTEASDSS